jgi:hypothetical protein
MYFPVRALSFITGRLSASFSSAAREKMKQRVMTISLFFTEANVRPLIESVNQLSYFEPGF